MEKSNIFSTPHTCWDRQDAEVDTVSRWWIWAGGKRPPSGQLMAKQFVCLCLDAFMCSIKWSLLSSNGASPKTHLQPLEEMRQEVGIGWAGGLLRKRWLSINLYIHLMFCETCYMWVFFCCSLVSLALPFNFCHNMQISLFMCETTTISLSYHSEIFLSNKSRKASGPISIVQPTTSLSVLFVMGLIQSF